MRKGSCALAPDMGLAHAGWCAQILQFSFAMPPAGEMAALGRWMAAAMAFIDAVGQYKLRPEQKVSERGSVAAPNPMLTPLPCSPAKWHLAGMLHSAAGHDQQQN